MKGSQQRPKNTKRRATLTLPTQDLLHAERITRSRKVNLSTVVAEALAEGLRVQAATERSEEVLNSYRRAFGGFSDEEMMLLDGIILDPPERRR
jgi:hypothetical protein